jgi:hypothetical protein
MANINLSTSEVGYANRNDHSAKNGLISILAILVFIVTLYGGLIAWKNSLDSKIIVATNTYNANYKELMNGMNVEVTDLQNRIFISKKLIKQDKLLRNILESVEKNIVSGVFLTTYDSDRDAQKLKLVGFANSYNDLSRQILSFKSSKAFSNVSVGASDISESGKISFSIDIEFK